jgi:hypothetical protein
MSRQTVSSQASRSHQDDALRLPQHSKFSQQPTPAHLSERNNVDVDEAKGGVAKKKSAAHVGPQNRPGEERDSLNEKQNARINRSHPGDAREVPGGAAKARRAGPHGKPIHADGSNDATSGKSVARIG